MRPRSFVYLFVAACVAIVGPGCSATSVPEAQDADRDTAPSNNLAPDAGEGDASPTLDLSRSVSVELVPVEWGLFDDGAAPLPGPRETTLSLSDESVAVALDVPPGAWSLRVTIDGRLVVDSTDLPTDRLVGLSGDIATLPFFNPTRTSAVFDVSVDGEVAARSREPVERAPTDAIVQRDTVGPWFEHLFDAVQLADDPGGATVELMHALRDHGGPVSTEYGVLFIAPAQEGEAAPQVRGSWNDFAADPDSELRRITPGLWARYIQVPAGRHAYKIYYPSGDAWVADLSNPHVEWDGFDPGTVGAFNSVLRPQGARLVWLPGVHSPQLQNARDVIVYVPASYDGGDENYATLYIHDGNESIVRGRYPQVAADTAATEPDSEAVLVFIALPDQDVRIEEYTMGVAGARGDDYVDFVAQTLVPLIDAEFRTRAEREARGVHGASLGGLVSFWAVLQYPGTFGYTAGMSSSFFWAEQFMIAQVEARGCQELVYYLDSGSPDDNFGVTEVMRDTLNDLGCDYEYVLEPGGEHDWAFWRGRFGGVLRHFARLHGG